MFHEVKEFTDALIKLVKYEGGNYRKKEFTKTTIDSFGAGGATSPNAQSYIGYKW